MSTEVLTIRFIMVALGFVLVGKLLFEYFFRSRRLLEHSNPRVPRLNRVRVYSILVVLGAAGLAPVGYNFGLPMLGVFILFGIAIVAAVIYLACTFWVISITGHL